MKPRPLRPLAVTFAEEDEPDFGPLVPMMAFASLCAQLQRKDVEIEKLKRALQRESHYLDQRVIRNK